MELLIKSFLLDWPVLTPILICSFLVIAVAIEKITYYTKNKRDIGTFIQNLQMALAKNNIGAAKRISADLGGIISEMTEEGLRIYTEQRAEFTPNKERVFQELMTFQALLQQENLKNT